jgi:hypothetical protein
MNRLVPSRSDTLTETLAKRLCNGARLCPAPRDQPQPERKVTGARDCCGWSGGPIRIQKTLESLYKSVEGEYHYADAAWAYVTRRTGVDLLGILRDLATERTAQHGQ